MIEDSTGVINMLMAEYRLIQSKSSRLSATQRHDVVRRVEALIRSGVIKLNNTHNTQHNERDTNI